MVLTFNPLKKEIAIFSQPASGLLVTGNIKKLTLLGICEQVAVAGDVGKIATMTSDVVVNGKVQTVFSQSGEVTADSIGTVNTLHGTVTPK